MTIVAPTCCRDISAKTAVSTLILKYVARASVAVPFVVVLGFALAGIAAMLVDRFGHIAGYWLMAGGLAAICVIAAIFVSARKQKEVAANKLKQPTHLSLQLRLPARRRWPFSVAYWHFRAAAPPLLRWPSSWDAITNLSYLRSFIGLLFWPTPEEDEDTSITAFKPNGSDEASPSLYRH